VEKSKWSKRALAAYFVLFTAVLYLPMILMAILSFQAAKGLPYFPMKGFSGTWWQALFDESVPGSHADAIQTATTTSVYIALVCGVLTAFFALTLSMAFRRRFRGDGLLFYLIMLGLMTPGILLSLGTQLFWQLLGHLPGTWTTVIGTNTVWAIPFGFLVMVAVWNRYDRRVEEASRDLGASSFRTFREVTLPLIWTGIFGALLFGFTLSWNEYDRTAALISSGQITLPVQIFTLTVASVIRPDLYALGTATTIFILAVVGIVLLAAAIGIGRRKPVVPVEAQAAEELGEVAGIDVSTDPLEPGGASGARAR